ncbi:hypothetical protein [Mesonia sp. K7]|uniref:hypothetical protein n=1 Tax=Mesonia sp. K7 TaxID=2218606 RepID=UPI000DA7FA3F|nr:hypothetical protein [Mesonia sp. K7]PZD77105.1 hypothetical protein DNG35_09675 [Mesonia sp. K7]
MQNFKQIHIFSLWLLASLALFSCSKDDDENETPGTTVNIEDGRIAFEVSGFENTFMEGDVVYYLNNQYDIKYFQIADNEAITHNDAMWHITFEQNSNNEIALPEPGEYPIVQGLTDTYDQTSFNATISAWTNVMTETGTTFGGNNGAVTGTLTIVSNTDEIVKGTFSFEAFSSEGEKITVTNGQFAAPKNTW